ncbi:MAG: hypothetical protein WCG50_07860 [Rhodoferax sp.]|uniref:FFLEELY motif protein n=1 Tax=Rhodoferax sp. TaxID=50421 RepID=UPI003017CAEC
MDAANIIRNTVARVAQLRQQAASTPGLARAVSDIKHLQARRFAGTYFDLLHSDHYKPAGLFFLEELYSDKDYSLRDAQFARMAGPLDKIFPQSVVDTAVALAQLHGLTEELDMASAQQWLAHPDTPEALRYVLAWRAVDRRADRNQQLATVMTVGHELARLTRLPGLRLMLKMMRGPANLAGISALQHFLELGFDTFAAMGRKPGGTAYFLETVRTRESRLIDLLFDADVGVGETELQGVLHA